MARARLAAGDAEAAELFLLLARSLEAGSSAAPSRDDIFSAHALPGKEWAQSAGYYFEPIAIDHLYQKPVLFDRYPAKWQEVVRAEQRRFARGGYLIHAGAPRIVLWNWQLESGAIDEAFFVLAGNGNLLWDDRYWLKNIAGGNFIKAHNETDNSILVDLSGIQAARLKGPHILLGSRTNYGHFLLNFVAKLFYLEHHPELRDVPIVCAKLKDYHFEILDILGIERRRIVEIGDPAVQCNCIDAEELYVLADVPWAMGAWYVGERLASRIDVPDMPDCRRLYLSRQGLSPRHRVANEAEVQEFLAGRSFKIVHPETLSVRETICMVRNAEIIVTPPGASHANYTFARPETTIICLYPPGIFGPNMGVGGSMTFAAQTPVVERSIIVPGEIEPGEESGFDALDPDDINVILRVFNQSFTYSLTLLDKAIAIAEERKRSGSPTVSRLYVGELGKAPMHHKSGFGMMIRRTARALSDRIAGSGGTTPRP